MTAKPRVLMVCHARPGLVSGGTEAFSHNLFRALKANGRTHPMFLAGVTALHRAEPAGSRLRVIDGAAGDECLLWVGGFDRLMLAPTDAAPFVSAFSQLLLTFRPDIVHLHYFSLIGLEALAVIRRQVPNAGIVATLHDYHPICANDGLMLDDRHGGTLPRRVGRRLPRLLPGDRRRALCGASAAHTDDARPGRPVHRPEPHALRPLRRLGLPSDRIEMIGNAVVDAERQPAAADDRSRTTFGYFGNITRTRACCWHSTRWTRLRRTVRRRRCSSTAACSSLRRPSVRRSPTPWRGPTRHAGTAPTTRRTCRG